jgi:hypothetical protein
MGLAAHDMGYLVVHRPPWTLGGLCEVVIAAGVGQIDDGMGGAGEGLDEVVHTLGRCRD